MPRSLKVGLLAATGALVIGAVAIGTAVAQPTPTPTTSTQQPQREGARRLLELVASKLGVAPDRLQQAFMEARQELGVQGRPGPFGPHRGHARERIRGMMQRGLEIVANELHVSVEQLRSELPGTSLAAVSRNHGVDPQQVATALSNAATARIDAAANAGRITADQATGMKQRVAELIQRMMDRQLPERGQDRPGLRGPGRPI